ncbi:MAG: hypothetical protein ACK5CL_04705, partial [Sphingomonadales bacterium]
MHYTWQEVTTVIQGEALTADAAAVLIQPAFDTRRIGNPARTMFFALPGSHRQGKEFVQAAFKQGVRSFVVPQEFDAATLSGCNV